jgi:DNA-binding NarL/FixJ family response regulator
MRVLICDQESEMLETVSRWFEVDTATSKSTCIDLMRANPFDVVVASERLSDGSGLELLSHIAARWPSTLRVLVIEPERLRLLRGKLGPFKLHATMRYPIEEEELETVLNRMGELLVDAGSEAEEEPEPEPPPPPPPPPPAVTTRAQKLSSSQQGGKPSSPGTRAPSQAGALQKQSSRSAQAARPLGAPVPPEPPVVRRKLGNYTPLGAPEDKALRIVERQFDQTIAPLAAKAIRSREEAIRPRTQKEKLGTLKSHLTDALKRLLKR